MSLVRGIPLYQVYPSQLSAEQAQDIYRQAKGLARRLAGHGLVHCDLNEFNLLVDLSGIQAASATTRDEDPYVRHSGQESVAGRSLGALSKPSFLRTDDDPMHVSRDNGNPSSPEAAEPAEYLDNGQPRPVVTLIDFPQMVSTSHPNARELYRHDVRCLRRFFANKLRFQMGDDDGDDDDEWTSDDAKWESLVASSEAGGDCDVDRGTAADNSKTRQPERIQLDAQLRASGYAPRDSQDLELYYFDAGLRPVASAVIPEEEVGEGDESDSSDDEGSELEDAASNGSVSHGDESSTRNDDGTGPRKGKDAKPSDVSVGTDEDEDHRGLEDSATPMDERGHQRLAAEERARLRVRRQIDGQKRKQRRHGAFRKRNSSKTFVKGKRIYADDY
jgi:serine/threonine-protein kinase RIO1